MNGDRLLSVRDIVGNRKKGERGILPVSRSTWWRWAKEGRVPEPVRLHGSTCWRASDIQKLVENGTGGGR